MDESSRSIGLWPPFEEWLTDPLRCPSCFATLTGARCDFCAIVYTTDDILRLTTNGAGMLDRLAVRRMLLDTFRERTAMADAATAAQIATLRTAPAAQTAAPGVDVEPEPVFTGRIEQVADAVAAPIEPGVSSAQPARVAEAAQPRVPARPPLPDGVPAAPRRSSVQMLLLATGVILVGVAAAFFLTLAFITGGILMRSAVIALVTVIVIAAASILRRRELTATAEGIAALGVGLLGLDAWAVRANDLGGTASASAITYWGVALIVVGVVAAAWAWFSRLVVPRIAAWCALVIGIGCAVASLGPGTAESLYIGGVTALGVTLVVALLPRLAGRTEWDLRIDVAVLRSLALIGFVVSVCAIGFIRDDSVWVPIVAAGLIAAGVAGHGITLAMIRSVYARLVFTAAPVILVAGITLAAMRTQNAVALTVVPVLSAGVLTILFDVAALRAGQAHARINAAFRAARWGSIGIGALAALLAFPPIVTGIVRIAVRAITPFTAHTVIWPDPTGFGTAATAVALFIIAVAAWRSGGVWSARRTIVPVLAAPVILILPAVVAAPVAVTVGFAAACVLGVVLWAVGRRILATVLLTVGGVLLLLSSLALPLTFVIGAVTVQAVLLTFMRIERTRRPALAAAAVAHALVTAAWAPTVAGAAGADVPETLDGAVMVPLVAAVMLLVFMTTWTRRFALETLAAAAVAVIPCAVLTVFALTDLSNGATPWTLASAIFAAAAAIIGWLRRDLPDALRLGAGIALAPFTAAAVVQALAALDAHPTAQAIASAGIGLIAAAAALVVDTISTSPDGARHRRGVDAGAAAVFLMLAAVAIGVRPSDWWPVALVAACTALVFACSRDGLFVSTSARRHLVWAALGLGALALWAGLSAHTTQPEPYVLPVAGGLLVIAALSERARRRVGRSANPPALILFAAVAAAALVLVLGARELPFAAAWGVGSATLLLAAAWIPVPASAGALRLAVLVGAAVGAVAAGVRVAIQSTSTPATSPFWSTTPTVTDIALIAAAAVLFAAAVGASKTAMHARGTVVPALACTAIAALVMIGLIGASSFDGAAWRPVLAIVIAAALAVTVFVRRRGVFSPPVGVVAGAGGILVAAVALVVARPEPAEMVTLPIAGALLVIGVLDARRAHRHVGVLDDRRVAMGAWATGLCLLFLPTLVLALETNWRGIVVLAVAGAALLTASLAISTVTTPSASRPASPAHVLSALHALAAPTVAVTAAFVFAVPLVVGRWGWDLSVEAWALPAAGMLVISGLLIGRATQARATTLATVVFGLGWALAIGTEAWVLLTTDPQPLRAAIIVTAAAALLPISAFVRRAPLTVVVGLVSWAAGAGVGLLSLLVTRPLDVVIVPLALGLLAYGTIRMRGDADLRSWGALGPALALLLVPALLLNIVDAELWRSVGLGVVALAVLLAGVRLRLQAPFVLGGVVVIAHAVAQLWPWVASVYDPSLWWLWVGVGGVLLIVVAATYERRMRELRAAVLHVRGLR